MTVDALQSGRSSVYRCETCAQRFSKITNGAMGRFKHHLLESNARDQSEVDDRNA